MNNEIDPNKQYYGFDIGPVGNDANSFEITFFIRKLHITKISETNVKVNITDYITGKPLGTKRYELKSFFKYATENIQEIKDNIKTSLETYDKAYEMEYKIRKNAIKVANEKINSFNPVKLDIDE